MQDACFFSACGLIATLFLLLMAVRECRSWREERRKLLDQISAMTGKPIPNEPPKTLYVPVIHSPEKRREIRARNAQRHERMKMDRKKRLLERLTG